MFSTHAFTALLALALSPLAVRANVTPLTPAPGDSFNAGTTCTTTWSGDADSTTAWKGMAIELMTGPNLDMIHLTTVATNQDGTQSGSFSFPCPAVTLNAPVYFFQYSAPGTPKQWTTRFTIASASGQAVPAPNATQPDAGNEPIPWGAGSLQDPSSAVPAPSFAAEDDGDGASGSGSGSSAVPSGGANATSSLAGAPAKTAVGGTTPSGMVTQLSSSSSSSVPASSAAANTSAPAPSTTASGAVGKFGFDARVGVMSAAALVIAAACLW